MQVLLIVMALIIVCSIIYWFVRRPVKMRMGTILESSVELTSRFEIVTILTIKNTDETITHAYLSGIHKDLKEKHIEYQLSKLGYLGSKTEYYEEESFDDSGNKIIHKRVRDYIELTKGYINKETDYDQ